MKKKIIALLISLSLIYGVLFIPKVSADFAVSLSVKIHRITKIDTIEGSSSDQADWYYYVGISEDGGLYYDWTIPYNIPMNEDDDDWFVNEVHSFEDIKSETVTIAIMLCEDDGFLTPLDDLADISSDSNGGELDKGNPITPPIMGVYDGVYVGSYNIKTNKLTGDTTILDSGYYKTSGEYDNNSADELDAELWFDLSVKYITITSPSYGEIWKKGETRTINWDSESAGSNVKIELYKSGLLEKTIESNTQNDGSYSWTIQTDISTSYSYKIRITSLTYSDIYDESEYFSIYDPPRKITITYPSSGETFYLGETEIITWIPENAGNYVYIELYKDGYFYSTIDSYTSNDGSYSWAIPSSLSSGASYKIKITSLTYSDVYDESSYFSIDKRYINVYSPYSTDTWYQGETKTITWDSENAGDSVKIELYKSSSLIKTILTSTSNDGSYSWKIPTTLASSSYYRIKIISTKYSDTSDYSDYFSIEEEPSIYVKSANSVDTCYNGEDYTINWNTINTGNYVKIDLYKNNKYHSTIVTSTYDDGSYTWKIPEDLNPSSSYKIKITSTSDSSVYDYSNSYITIKKTWLQKWWWVIVLAVIFLLIFIGIIISIVRINKKNKKEFEIGKKEIIDTINKATKKKNKQKKGKSKDLYCTGCGKKLVLNSTFCDKCGKKVDK